jgi:hypothetical protein
MSFGVRLRPALFGHAADLPAQGARRPETYHDKLVAEHAGKGGGSIAVSWLPLGESRELPEGLRRGR